jgi:fatty-acyl-CoA synthase/long-chain acyl-CoA synthetase
MAEPVAPPDVLTLYARIYAEKPAVIDDRGDGSPEIWSFAELERQANRLGNALLGLGVAARDKVVWCGQNSAGVVRLMHAARKIGATAVPLNYRLSPEEAAYVIDNSDAVVVYADAEHAELLRKIRADIPKVRHVLIFAGAGAADQLDVAQLLAGSSDAEPRVERGDGGTMIYTSGTTGKPKGALRSSARVDPASQLALLQLFGYGADDVYLTTGPLYHSGPGGFMGVAHALGNTVVLQRKFDPEDWLRLVARYRVTSTFSAPTPIRMICNLPADVKARYDRSSMRIMIANAAPWSYALKEAYLADFPEQSLFEVYGSTELGVNCVLEPKDQRRKPGSCGKPAPGVELLLVDEEGRDVSEPDVPGELFVRSIGAFDTYYKAQEKYESNRRGGFLTVGDIAYRDDEGYYYICDRKSDMIISGGMNIYPAEIESALERDPRIYDVAVIGIPSEEWGESVHAVIVARPGTELSEAGVIAFAREHLASYKIPRSVTFIGEIPRNPSGKILKRVLRAPFWSGQARQVS